MNAPAKERPCPLGLFPDRPTPRLYDRIIEVLRVRHYSRRTEEAYVGWIRRFIQFHQGQHPLSMGRDEVTAFLSHLAVDGHVAASTQNQALAALLLLYQHALNVKLPWLDDVVRAKRPKRLPVVLTRDEVRRVLAQLDGTYRLIGLVQYGSGLRLLECLRLRVKDLDFALGQIVVREGKGDKDRRTMLPAAVVPDLQAHLERVRALHQRDLAKGLGAVLLPNALERKLPSASKQWIWQYVFLLEDGYDIRTVQELLGHASVETTMVYTHVLNKGGRGVTSPLDSAQFNSSATLRVGDTLRRSAGEAKRPARLARS